MTLGFIDHIKENYSSVLAIFPIELEPCSLFSLKSAKYKLKINRKSYEDYINVHKKGHSLGYSTDVFSEKEIMNNIEKMKEVVGVA